jgi:hypothetical protein
MKAVITFQHYLFLFSMLDRVQRTAKVSWSTFRVNGNGSEIQCVEGATSKQKSKIFATLSHSTINADDVRISINMGISYEVLIILTLLSSSIAERASFA